MRTFMPGSGRPAVLYIVSHGGITGDGGSGLAKSIPHDHFGFPRAHEAHDGIAQGSPRRREEIGIGGCRWRSSATGTRVGSRSHIPSPEAMTACGRDAHSRCCAGNRCGWRGFTIILWNFDMPAIFSFTPWYTFSQNLGTQHIRLGSTSLIVS